MTTQSMTFAELAGYFAGYFAGLGSQLAGLSFRRPLETVSFYLASQARRNFDEGHAPDGTPWAPLLHPSAKRGGASAKPLRDTGLLMASLTGKGSGHVERITDTAIEWGTNVNYGTFHQFGTSRMVARPFLGVTPKMEETISRIILEWVEKQLKGKA